MGGGRRAPREKLADPTLEQTAAAIGLRDELAGRLVDVWNFQAVTGGALRADDDELEVLYDTVWAWSAGPAVWLAPTCRFRPGATVAPAPGRTKGRYASSCL
jgi:hypothetical protein